MNFCKLFNLVFINFIKLTIRNVNRKKDAFILELILKGNSIFSFQTYFNINYNLSTHLTFDIFYILKLVLFKKLDF